MRVSERMSSGDEKESRGKLEVMKKEEEEEKKKEEEGVAGMVEKKWNNFLESLGNCLGGRTGPSSGTERP